MGVTLSRLSSYYEYEKDSALPERPGQVLSLAIKAFKQISETGLPDNLSHVLLATSCPDMIAPSLGQMLTEEFHEELSECHIIDIVQGCTGGVSAMILGSQLSEYNQSSVLVLQADAGRKATSDSNAIHKNFGNGSFACLLKYESSAKGLLYSKTQQYKGLSEVVTIGLGHDADKIIKNEIQTMSTDPRKNLGLSMNNTLALKLFSNAELFYLEFIKNTEQPEIMILHQVNPLIISHLKSTFSKYDVEFIDVATTTGNCGAASVGIALHLIKDKIADKKIMLCSFGTGGIITAGLWQN